MRCDVATSPVRLFFQNCGARFRFPSMVSKRAIGMMEISGHEMLLTTLLLVGLNIVFWIFT